MRERTQRLSGPQGVEVKARHAETYSRVDPSQTRAYQTAKAFASMQDSLESANSIFSKATGMYVDQRTKREERQRKEAMLAFKAQQAEAHQEIAAENENWYEMSHEDYANDPRFQERASALIPEDAREEFRNTLLSDLQGVSFEKYGAEKNKAFITQKKRQLGNDLKLAANNDTLTKESVAEIVKEYREEVGLTYDEILPVLELSHADISLRGIKTISDWAKDGRDGQPVGGAGFQRSLELGNRAADEFLLREKQKKYAEKIAQANDEILNRTRPHTKEELEEMKWFYEQGLIGQDKYNQWYRSPDENTGRMTSAMKAETRQSTWLEHLKNTGVDLNQSDVGAINEADKQRAVYDYAQQYPEEHRDEAVALLLANTGVVYKDHKTQVEQAFKFNRQFISNRDVDRVQSAVKLLSVYESQTTGRANDFLSDDDAALFYHLKNLDNKDDFKEALQLAADSSIDPLTGKPKAFRLPSLNSPAIAKGFKSLVGGSSSKNPANRSTAGYTYQRLIHKFMSNNLSEAEAIEAAEERFNAIMTETEEGIYVPKAALDINGEQIPIEFIDSIGEQWKERLDVDDPDEWVFAPTEPDGSEWGYVHSKTGEPYGDEYELASIQNTYLKVVNSLRDEAEKDSLNSFQKRLKKTYEKRSRNKVTNGIMTTTASELTKLR